LNLEPLLKINPKEYKTLKNPKGFVEKEEVLEDLKEELIPQFG